MFLNGFFFKVKAYFSNLIVNLDLIKIQKNNYNYFSEFLLNFFKNVNKYSNKDMILNSKRRLKKNFSYLKYSFFIKKYNILNLITLKKYLNIIKNSAIKGCSLTLNCLKFNSLPIFFSTLFMPIFFLADSIVGLFLKLRIQFFKDLFLKFFYKLKENLNFLNGLKKMSIRNF